MALKRKLKTSTPKPSDTTVVVLNGYVVPGAAAEARYLLSQRGFATVEGAANSTGNAPWDDQFHTKVFYNGGKPRARAAAVSMAGLFGAAEAVPYASRRQCTGPPLQQPRSCHLRPLANGAMLTVVVGQTFHNALAPAPAREEITRTPPDVRRDRPATVSLVRAQKNKVDFDLMVPSVLDRSSSPDCEMPVRTYRVAEGYDAVRLVFRRGLEYWGVQQMNWADAPVLESRSLHRVINGRGYDFYYRGRKLHMIVLRQGDASYWVVNTLLDSLSNETMIAIAKGLQPLDPAEEGEGQGRGEAAANVSRIAVFGAGYVGLVTGACFAELGHDVVVRDVVPEKIEALRAGRVPIHEPGLQDVIERAGERLRFTLDVGEALDGAELAFVAVGTPPTYSGDPDLSAVWTVVDELPAGVETTLVMKSTVPPGTGERVRRALDARGLSDVAYVSNPEFLAEGTAVHDFMHPDRVVVGAFEPEGAERVAALYEPLDTTIVVTDVASAEMIKLASNAFLSTRISFINEIASVCELVGADVVDVAAGIGLDHRLGPHFLKAGLGFGGSCFPKDISALKQLAGNSGYHFQLLAAVIEVNELQRRRVIQKLEKHLGDLHGKEIARAGPRLQAGDGRPARGAEPRHRSTPPRRGGGRARVGSGCGCPRAAARGDRSLRACSMLCATPTPP